MFWRESFGAFEAIAKVVCRDLSALFRDKHDSEHDEPKSEHGFAARQRIIDVGTCNYYCNYYCIIGIIDVGTDPHRQRIDTSQRSNGELCQQRRRPTARRWRQSIASHRIICSIESAVIEHARIAHVFAAKPASQVPCCSQREDGDR